MVFTINHNQNQLEKTAILSFRENVFHEVKQNWANEIWGKAKLHTYFAVKFEHFTEMYV